MAHLSEEGSNNVFASMDEWERHLAQLGLEGLWCGNEHIKPEI